MPVSKCSCLVFCVLPLLCFLSACGGSDSSSSDGDSASSDGDAEAAPEDGDSDGDSGEVGETDEPAFDDPEKAGPYLIGASRFTVTYEDPDKAGRVRELPCVVWYPAVEIADTFAYDGWLDREGVYEDATPDRTGAPYPLLAFSHGNSGLAEQSWTVMEYLATHGVVSASCNHVGNTAADWQDDGELKLPQSIHDRPYDISAMIDTMISISGDDAHLLARMVDPDRIAASGHSLGGFTTLVVSGGWLHFTNYAARCQDEPTLNYCDLMEEADTSMVQDGQFADPRLKAAVAYAPAGYPFFNGAEGLAYITLPILIMAGDRDQTCPLEPEVRPIYQSVSSDEKALVVLTDTGHMSFSNICDLIGGVNDYLIEEGCSDDFASPEMIFHSMNHYTLAFLRRYLDNDKRYNQYLTAEDPETYDLNAIVERP